MKKCMYWASILFLSLIGLGLLLTMLGLRINTSDSIPVGLYRITNSGNLKNSYVIFCPDGRATFKQGLARDYIDKGLCASGYGYLMKKVVAVEGDTISATSSGVFVNQALLPLSKPRVRDGLNRLLPQWKIKNYKLKKNEILTMTNQSEWSFDSRYYGLIHLSQIKGILIPIWVKTLEK